MIEAYVRSFFNLVLLNIIKGGMIMLRMIVGIYIIVLKLFIDIIVKGIIFCTVKKARIEFQSR